MNTALGDAIAARIGEATGRPGLMRETLSVGGGSLHETVAMILNDGRRYFVKTGAPLATFEAEAAGLRALAAPGVLRVADVVASGETDDGVGFLVLEWIERSLRRQGELGRSFFADFGRRLAELHRATRAERYGFDHDNVLGATPQPNGWMDDWVSFWRERRLQPQLTLARSKGVLDDHLSALTDRLLDRLEGLIGLTDGEPPCLLHGDLWGGNYMVDEDGQPVLIDPAVYYGQREADLAMTRLFGGFEPWFYKAYDEAWPLPPDSERRMAVYELYHLLNHLNLFGVGYRSQCVAVLRRLV